VALHRYLVCYDVGDPRRLERTFKKMNGFGQAVQYSVFVCDLSPTGRVLLEQALRAILNLSEDRVLILDAGPTEGRGQECFTLLGKALPLPTRGPTVV
jgi:CRISPR-associated protein Cas2